MECIARSQILRCSEEELSTHIPQGDLISFAMPGSSHKVYEKQLGAVSIGAKDDPYFLFCCNSQLGLCVDRPMCYPQEALCYETDGLRAISVPSLHCCSFCQAQARIVWIHKSRFLCALKRSRWRVMSWPSSPYGHSKSQTAYHSISHWQKSA